MELSVPDQGDPSGLASAQVKDVTVDLPPGLTVSPGGVAGLVACSDAQLDLHSEAEAACPASSQVGTVEFASAALPDPLRGAVYLGDQQGDERFRFFVVVPGPGITLKFVTALHPDPASGHFAATLQDLPQVAIDRIALNLDGGPVGLLASPLGCGPASGTARFVPYGGGPAVTSTAFVSIARVLPGLACPGPLPFAPKLLVSGSSHRAGAPSSFTTVLQRRSGEQLPAQFSLTLPAGLSAALGSIPACPEPAVSTGACPDGSRVGSVRAEVGSGSSRVALPGSVFLAGPYRHAPFSLVMAFRAAVGPFDLGTMAVRSSAQIDPHSGRVTVTSGRLPDMVEGVSVRFQAIQFALDRPGLVHNPTSCGPHSIDATIESQEGAQLEITSPYRVAGCRRLGFAPRVRLALPSGAGSSKGDGVRLRVSTHLRRADASLRALSLSLPPSLEVGISQLRAICSRVDARRGLCPAGSRVGSAQARTAMLDEPLKGSMYVVQPRGGGEPDLWTVLSAAGMQFSFRGTSTTEHGRFVTRIAGLPDMPLSEFTMRLGSKSISLLSLGADLCANGRPRQLEAEFSARGQNGARLRSQVPIATRPRCGATGGR
jgi:hypothetical protein